MWPGIVWEWSGCCGTTLCWGLHWQPNSGVIPSQGLALCPGPLWSPGADSPYVSDSWLRPTVPSAFPWILGLNSCFVCLGLDLTGSALSSGVGQVTQPMASCLMGRGRCMLLQHGGNHGAAWCIKSKRGSALPLWMGAGMYHNIFAGQFSGLSFPSHSQALRL